MDERLQGELESYFPNGEPDPDSEVDVENMRTYVEGFTQIPMQGIAISYLDLPLYRARYDDGFRNTEISQYGYKPDAIRGSICRLRYNLPKEQVLYTSTYPLTAFREIEDVAKGYKYFYLSVWTKKANSPAPVVYHVLPDNPQQLSGNAKDYYDALKGHMEETPLVYHWQSRLGGCLEATCNGGVNNGYLMSSTIASRLFRENDVLLTVSQKSNDSELNITYKHTAYDFVRLNTVFHCKCPDADSQSLLFDVDEIGIVNNVTHSHRPTLLPHVFREWSKYLFHCQHKGGVKGAELKNSLSHYSLLTLHYSLWQSTLTLEYIIIVE